MNKKDWDKYGWNYIIDGFSFSDDTWGSYLAWDAIDELDAPLEIGDVVLKLVFEEWQIGLVCTVNNNDCCVVSFERGYVSCINMELTKIGRL